MLSRNRLSVVLGIALSLGLAWQTASPAVCSDTKGQEKKSEQPKDSDDAETIDKLIGQLSADSYKEREDAVRRLIAIGAPALALLQRIANDTQADPDLRLRAARAAFAIGTIRIESVRVLGEHSAEPNNPNFRWATRVAISPDGKRAVTAGVVALHYWDLSNQKLIRVFGQNKQGYWSVSFSPDGKRIIAGARNRTLCLFEASSGKLLKEMTGHSAEIWGAVFTADGKQAISGSWDRSIRVWDLETGKQSRAFNVRDQVRGFALSPDGKLLAASHFAVVNGPGTIRIWDVQKGTEIRSMTGHQMEISQLAFSPDGKQLVSSSFDKTVRIWRVADGKEIKQLKGQNGRIEGAVFTPDGKRILSCCAEGDPSLRMWDASSGKQLGESDKMEPGFLGLAALSDSRQCLTVGRDGAVRLWRWVR
jgi:WD40 repeat protein